MRYASVCSGIEAVSVAWEPLGLVPAFFAEIDPFCSALLSQRWPGVQNRGDFTRVEVREGDAEILVGGTPCQSFSVAGRRLGLDDPRGNLAIHFLQLVRQLRPRWVVWENVPGVLSSSGGRDFGAFLGLLGQLGYGWAYRVLDAQHFGVPQRRRRVFVVGHSGGLWQRAVAVLFERESLCGHPAEGGEAESGPAPRTSPSLRGQHNASHRPDSDAYVVGCLNSGGNNGGFRTEPGEHLTVDAVAERDSGSSTWGEGVGTLSAHDAKDGYASGLIAHTLRDDGFDASEDGTGRGTPLVPVAYQCHGTNVGSMGMLRSGHNEGGGVPFVVNAAESCAKQSHARPSEVSRCLDGTGGFASSQGGTIIAESQPLYYSHDYNQDRVYGTGGPTPALTANDSNRARNHLVAGAVRRLTPTECERLMGLPDGYTLIPVKPVPAKSQTKARSLCEAGDGRFADLDGVIYFMSADGPRYRAIGNSMAVPVVRWLGQRLLQVEAIP